MYNFRLLFILFMTGILMFFGCTNKNNVRQMFSVNIPTIQQEAEYVFNLIQKSQYFEENGYNFILPASNFVNILKSKVYEGVNLTEDDFIQFKSHFENEIFNKNDYMEYINNMENLVEIANQQMSIFEDYRQKWGFYIPNSYNIILSLYGTGGQVLSNDTILIQVPKDGDLLRILGIILHEITHIGINEAIICKYNISNEMNERIADHFLIYNFKHILPNYYLQNIGDASIDVIFNENDVFDYLPIRVGEFMEKIQLKNVPEMVSITEAKNIAENFASNNNSTELEGIWLNKWNSNFGFIFIGNGFCLLPVAHLKGNFIIEDGKILFSDYSGKKWTQSFRISNNELWIQEVPSSNSNYGEFIKQ